MKMAGPKSTTPWVIHGFRGSAELAKSLVRHGFFLSFGENPLKRSSPGWEKTAEALKAVPLNRLFLETDDTEPPATDITEVHAIAAKVMGCSTSELSEALAANAATVFKLDA